jgi:hypothetical protein
MQSHPWKNLSYIIIIPYPKTWFNPLRLQNYFKRDEKYFSIGRYGSKETKKTVIVMNSLFMLYY